MAEGYIKASGNVHWMTPLTEVYEVVVPILGYIDLDPCSHPASHVPAERRLFGEDRDDDDGMLATWSGRVFCNPTYGSRWNKEMGPRPPRWRPMPQWIEKMALSYRQLGLNGGIDTTVLALLPSYTERRWLHDVIKPTAAMVAFPRGRIAFDLPGEGTQTSPGHASMYVLWSAETDVLARARKVFAERGICHEFR